MNTTWQPRLRLPVRLCVLSMAIVMLPVSVIAVGSEEPVTVVEEPASTQKQNATVDEDAITEEKGSDAFPSGTARTNDPATRSDASGEPDLALVKVVDTEDGLMISSNNPAALDRLEKLINQLLAAQAHRVPLPANPYHIGAGDVLAISVAGTDAGAPIEGDYIVEPSGSVALGPAYGRVIVAGMTLEDAENAVATHLQKVLRDPKVQITTGQLSGLISGAPPRSASPPPGTGDAAPPWSNRASTVNLDSFRSVAIPSSTTESLGVLRKIAYRAKADYDRIKELAEQNTVSVAEVARAKSDFEISLERARQAERGLKYYRLLIEAAEADYQSLLEEEKRTPNTVTAGELRKAKLAVELAKAKLEELSE